MFFSRNYGAPHFLAVASATTAVVGFGFDDVKWAISIAASLFGSAVALYIFRGEMRAHNATLDRVRAELSRPRVVASDQADEQRNGKPPIGSDGGAVN